MSSVLQRAADATACQMLNDIGSAATQLAAWTMWTPKVALVPLTIGGLSYMANNLLCPDQPFPDWPEPGQDIDGCKKVKDGYGKLEYKPGGNDGWFGSASEVIEIVSVESYVPVEGLYLRYVNVKTVSAPEGQVIDIFFSSESAAIGASFRIRVEVGSCEETGGGNNPGNPTPDFEPYPYTDPETNCDYTLKLEGFVQQYADGPVQPVWNIQSTGLTARADGGRMGGCNLSPTIYIGGDGSGGGDGGKPPQFPVPPEIPPDDPDGVPWWLPPLLGATTGALLNQIARLMNDTFNYSMEPGVFDLVAPCNYDVEGKNEIRQWAFPQTPLILRLYDHQVAMMEIMQQHLDWKTPICGNVKPTLEGTWISTHWRSDADSPNSNRPLRKLFRYRSKSTRTTNELQDYWRDFTWRSGPFCVIHKGAWWGTPQIWAESANEGKRVIRHAASEAGIDPDQIGEWAVSSSGSPRYGMSREMRLDTSPGERWVTRREGPSGFPEL